MYKQSSGNKLNKNFDNFVIRQYLEISVLIALCNCYP